MRICIVCEIEEIPSMASSISFLIIVLVLMFIATLFQVGEYISTNEILTVLSISFTLVFLYGLALSSKILVTHGKGNWSLKNNLRTLISLIVLLIRNLLYKIMFIKREFSLFSFN